MALQRWRRICSILGPDSFPLCAVVRAYFHICIFRLREHLQNRKNLFTKVAGEGHTSPNRPLMILLDRTIDLAAPLHHPWTYQALCSDLLGMKANRVSLPVWKLSTLYIRNWILFGHLTGERGRQAELVLRFGGYRRQFLGGECLQTFPKSWEYFHGCILRENICFVLFLGCWGNRSQTQGVPGQFCDPWRFFAQVFFHICFCVDRQQWLRCRAEVEDRAKKTWMQWCTNNVSNLEGFVNSTVLQGYASKGRGISFGDRFVACFTSMKSEIHMFFSLQAIQPILNSARRRCWICTRMWPQHYYRI